jgi:hypothetical protein
MNIKNLLFSPSTYFAQKLELWKTYWLYVGTAFAVSVISIIISMALGLSLENNALAAFSDIPMFIVSLIGVIPQVLLVPFFYFAFSFICLWLVKKDIKAKDVMAVNVHVLFVTLVYGILITVILALLQIGIGVTFQTAILELSNPADITAEINYATLFPFLLVLIPLGLLSFVHLLVTYVIAYKTYFKLSTARAVSAAIFIPIGITVVLVFLFSLLIGLITLGLAATFA